MVTLKEIITVTRDDPMFDIYEKQFEDWQKEECTLSVTWTRNQVIRTVKKEK